MHALMGPWLDSHTHLDDPDEPRDRLDDSLRRLVAAGWRGALTAGYGPERFARSREVALDWPCVRRAIGMHPEYLARLSDDAARTAAYAAMCEELDGPSVIALGEIGLDRRYKDVWPLADQLRYLEHGLRVAAERQLPVVLHLVGWYGHALALLQRVGVPHGGAVHRWSGPVELIPAFEALGLGISVALEPRFQPERRRAVIQTIAKDKLLLETDWPYLDLAYDAAVVKMSDLGAQVAAWRGETAEDLHNQLAENAHRLYHLAP
jgi:TatD DNase family protein